MAGPSAAHRPLQATTGSTAIELRKLASETEAVFSLSSDEGGGEGWGEELCFIGFPLSPTLSPLVPRGARECMCKVHSSLNSRAMPQSNPTKAKTAKAVAASDMNILRKGSPLFPPCSRSKLSECARQAGRIC